MTRRFVVAILAGLILILSYQGVQAKEYVNDSKHYHLTVPDDWSEQQFSSVDVMFTHSTGANMNIISTSEPFARNDTTWLLGQTQTAYNQLLASFSDAVSVQNPRTFTTAVNRIAGDYVIDYDYSGLTLRARQVIFVSDYWNMLYILTFTAMKDEFHSYNSVWNEAVDTFTVVDEKAVDDSGNGRVQSNNLVLAIIIGVVIAVVACVVGFAAYRSKKKKAEEASRLQTEVQSPQGVDGAQRHMTGDAPEGVKVESKEPPMLDRKE